MTCGCLALACYEPSTPLVSSTVSMHIGNLTGKKKNISRFGIVINSHLRKKGIFSK